MATATVKRQREDFIAVLVVFAVFVVAAWMSWGFSPKARLAPFFISASCVVILLLEILPRLFGRRAAAPVAVETETGADPVAHIIAEDLGVPRESTPSAHPARHSSVNAMLTMLLPFVVLVFLIGVLPASLAFIFLYIRFVAKGSVLSAGVYAVSTFLVIWSLFAGLLGLFMYRGVFGLYIPFISG